MLCEVWNTAESILWRKHRNLNTLVRDDGRMAKAAGKFLDPATSRDSRQILRVRSKIQASNYRKEVRSEWQMTKKNGSAGKQSHQSSCINYSEADIARSCS